MIYFSDSVAQCNIWRQTIFFQLLLAINTPNIKLNAIIVGHNNFLSSST